MQESYTAETQQRSSAPAQTPADGVHDVVIIGGGLAGLTAAWRLGRAGRRATVLEAHSAVGGPISGHVLAELELDAGTEELATRSGKLLPILAELGFSAETTPPGVVAPLPVGASVGYSRNGTFALAKLPEFGLLGIPGDLDDPELARTLGAEGLARARRDRELPVGEVSDDQSIASLVRERMGERVLERLAGPLVGGIYSASPETIKVGNVAPGLIAALRQTGSLAAAVTQLRGQSPAGPSTRSLRGGMHKLTDALVTRIGASGGRIFTGIRAQAIAREADGWRIEIAATGEAGGADTGAGTGQADQLGAGPLAGAGGEAQTQAIHARELVLATPAASALTLLGQLDPALGSRTWPQATHVKLVTLVVDGAGLDSSPVGTGILMAPEAPGVQAKALTHMTAKWQWARAAATAQRPHRHVLRLSYGRAEAPERRSADTLTEQAARDARAIMGVPFDVVASDVRSWDHERIAPDRAATLQLVSGVTERTGLTVVGAWVSAIGLAAVVPHALQAADRLAERARR
jgi:oxygen-dependent protoporphyrinogen oxidase